MIQPTFEEPPELFSSDGEKIVIHRDGQGNFFSNHPEYAVRLALHEEAQRRKAEEDAKRKAEEEAAAAEAEDFDDEGGPSADNEDGVVEYEEMNAKDLVALAKERKLTIPSGSKRHDVIELLRADDEAKAAKGN